MKLTSSCSNSVSLERRLGEDGNIYGYALCRDDVTPVCLHRSDGDVTSSWSNSANPDMEDQEKMEAPAETLTPQRWRALFD
ncbi:hypothetical protein AB205_0037280, partial [Aquarana catesbeiana]